MTHDIGALRARLAAGDGPAFWRSLDAVADSPEFRAFLDTEYPAAARLAAAPDRRGFLKLMAASFAMSGLAACGQPDGRSQEIPYVRQPERIVPGAPLAYASAALVDGFANGITVTTRNGRPLKIEGNAEHPWSRGGTDVFAQASVLGLYDPFRLQTPQHLGRPSSWPAFRAAMTGRFAALKAAAGGRGLHLVTGPVTSPSLAAQIAAMRRDFPAMRWHISAPTGREALYEGARLALGRPLETRWRFDRARVVVSLDGDVLDPGPGQVGQARDWVEARRKAAAEGRLLALHHAGPSPNLTSAKAESPLAIGSDGLSALVRDLLAEAGGGTAADRGGPAAAWRARAFAALDAARGSGLVLAGTQAGPDLLAQVHRLNAALGNTGRTVFHTAPVPVLDAEPLDALAEAMRRGEVQLLVMLDVNPVYEAPGDLGFLEALARVPLKVHAGLYQDETAFHCDWNLPLAHPLEAWGDARSLDGTVTPIQPTIRPLYDGRSVPEILSILTDAEAKDGAALFDAHWRRPGEADAAWTARREAVLQAGFFPDTALAPETIGTPLPAAASARPAPAPSPAGPARRVEVVFRPDATVWDGSLANLAWLQELPKPLTKVVWGNVIAVSPGLAEREELRQGDVVTLEAEGRRIEGPVWIQPGQAEDAVTVSLGYGRRVPEQLADGLGYDAYPLRRSASPWRLAEATLAKTGRKAPPVTTQNHGTMEGHDLVRVQPVGAATPVASREALPSLYPPAPTSPGGRYDRERAWGMVIDLDACIGCNACVTACQSENNIPVVGKEEVALGRWLHWLRIDRYYEGGLEDPKTHFMPVPCMHCEQAPCEVGCPVEATVHDREGLNLMVYNRCVGTRACSSYCPYKVRRFNYLDYSGDTAPVQQQQRNPEVTVRARGVMEKCTYCVQRIAAARIDSTRGDHAPIPDGAVVTACQGACPTRAITFGDLRDSGSRVAAAAADPRNYGLLAELNTKPRTTYLARLVEAASATGAAKPGGAR
ncbi:prokaryotic molybdopterin-containing oxidoreductase family, iron-sulfur binding subunit [Methylobacterium sp. ap11]|uniref:TAT-variant-translocated molybdopterin oxidoreductase n=1 Tax=Methylobacterium sp. ap11 TaxID=1761799 RepID=UPI0008BF2A64|nr:TAT-variant-translocated molybdopterin oxidoreductase [Methylobacterium sp. ap11]SEP19725.1 prokaryotic molybdopterin-containing oxidoreductase family, iron-sulfur binding subunit [Methylobacterium sp. ap11]